MCTANGSDAVAERLRSSPRDGVRVLRGGCYGHCEIGPNVVVRAFRDDEELPDDTVDRLTLTEGANETVYSGLAPDDAPMVVAAHLEGRTIASLTRDAKLDAMPATSPVAGKIRALRARRRGR